MLGGSHAPALPYREVARGGDDKTKPPLRFPRKDSKPGLLICLLHVHVVPAKQGLSAKGIWLRPFFRSFFDRRR